MRVIAPPPWTDFFIASLLRKRRSCQHQTTRFRTAIDEVFPTPPSPAMKPFSGLSPFSELSPLPAPNDTFSDSYRRDISNENETIVGTDALFSSCTERSEAMKKSVQGGCDSPHDYGKYLLPVGS